MKNIFKLASVFMAIALLVSTLLLTGALVSAGEKNLLVNGDFKVLPDVGAAKPYDVENFGWKDGGIIAGESTFADGSFTLKNGNSGAKGFYQDIAFDSTKEYTLTLDVTVSSSTLDIRLYDSTGKSNLKSIVKYDAGTAGKQTVKFTPVDGAARIYLGGSNALFTITSAVLTDGSTEETTAASASETEVTVTEAEPTATATEAEPTATATEAEPTATATGTQPTTPGTAAAIATWSDTKGMEERDFSGAGHTGSIYMRQNVAGTNGTWGEFAATLGSLTADQYLDIVYTGTFTGALLENATLTSHVWSETESKTFAQILSVSDTQVNVRIEGPTTFANSAKPNLSLSIKNLQDLGEITDTHVTVTLYDKSVQPTGTEATEATGTEPTATATATATEAEPTATATEAEPTATEAEPTATEAEPTATEAEPTATEAEPTATETEPTETEASVTEPTATQPMTLVETVLVENNVGAAKTLKEGKTDAWFLVVNEVKADIAANGPIDPDKGEYYQITVTGSVDAGEADFHMGEDADWNEYWGQSGSFTTETSTVVATIPVVIPADLAGSVYLADSGEDGHTLTWTYAKVSVFRLGAATESSATATETATEASVTETEPVATETEASSTETEASSTETEASATETEASATETEPVATETEPAATETGTDGALLGDANGDGQINLKDVLAARKYVAGIETEIDLVASDVNKDGVVNMKDILLIRKFIAGLITSFDA